MLKEARIIYLHHSTGLNLWNGSRSTAISRLVAVISQRLSYRFYKKPQIPAMFEKYNRIFNTRYSITELTFPKKHPYGWHNYPFDYYNIWVKNEGNVPYLEEPTLEMLTKRYDIIIFKHCFPVSNIQPETGDPELNSDYKSASNYKLQYQAFKKKLSQFPDTKFILFTGPSRIKAQLTEEQAVRASQFYHWVISEWDSPDDNIYIWDFYKLETGGDIYMKEEFAVSLKDSHPNESFSGYAGGLLFKRIIDIIQNSGLETTLTGEHRT